MQLVVNAQRSFLCTPVSASREFVVGVGVVRSWLVQRATLTPSDPVSALLVIWSYRVAQKIEATLVAHIFNGFA